MKSKNMYSIGNYLTGSHSDVLAQLRSPRSPLEFAMENQYSSSPTGSVYFFKQRDSSGNVLIYTPLSGIEDTGKSI